MRTGSSEDDPPAEDAPEDATEGAPTARVVTVTIDDRARRSSPPPSVEVTPVVEVATRGARRLASRAPTKTHGITAPPEDRSVADPAEEIAVPRPELVPGPQEHPRVRADRREPEWSSKPTEMDLPKVGDFIPDDELISTRAPTPRLMARVPEPRGSSVAWGWVAVIALLALGVLLTVVFGLGG